jgi:hypothetical protein
VIRSRGESIRLNKGEVVSDSKKVHMSQKYPPKMESIDREIEEKKEDISEKQRGFNNLIGD